MVTGWFHEDSKEKTCFGTFEEDAKELVSSFIVSIAIEKIYIYIYILKYYIILNFIYYCFCSIYRFSNLLLIFYI